MSVWKKVKLGEIISISSGFSYRSDYLGEGDNLLLGMGCVSFKDSFVDSGARPYSQDCDEKYLVKPGDIVLATRQQSNNLPILAMPAIIPQKYAGKKLIVGANLYKVENHSDIDNRFIYYLLKGHDYVGYINGVKTGANVQMVSKRNVEAYSFLCPPLETCNRISTILSRYDSLIENYQKQIKLLEEAAQRLYKEWFIDLHFPGHENTNIIDGVPEGWKKKKVGEIAEFKRGKTITKKDVFEGNVPVVAGGLEPAYYCNKYNTANRVITISGSGANAGFTRLYYEKVWASDCSFADTNTTKWLHFVYCFLQSSKSAIDNMQKGAAQPHVYAKDINALDIMIPNAELLSQFEDLASKYFNKVQSLQSQLRLLAEARDRLLPKLMSGELTLEARAEEE